MRFIFLLLSFGCAAPTLPPMPTGHVPTRVTHVRWGGGAAVLELRVHEGSPQHIRVITRSEGDVTLVSTRDVRSLRLSPETGRLEGPGLHHHGTVHQRGVLSAHDPVGPLYLVRTASTRQGALSAIIVSEGNGPRWSLRAASVVCGNGIVEGREQCDDANHDPDDGCASCQVEAPVCVDEDSLRTEWRCTGEPSRCSSVDCTDDTECNARGTVNVYPRLVGFVRERRGMGRLRIGSRVCELGASCTVERTPCESMTLSASANAPARFVGWHGSACEGVDDCEVASSTPVHVVTEVHSGRTARQWSRTLPSVRGAQVRWHEGNTIVAFGHSSPLELAQHRLEGRLAAIVLDRRGEVVRALGIGAGVRQIAVDITPRGETLFAFVFEREVRLGQRVLRAAGRAVGLVRLSPTLEVRHAHAHPIARAVDRLSVVGVGGDALVGFGEEEPEHLRFDAQGARAVRGPIQPRSESVIEVDEELRVSFEPRADHVAWTSATERVIEYLGGRRGEVTDFSADGPVLAVAREVQGGTELELFDVRYIGRTAMESNL